MAGVIRFPRHPATGCLTAVRPLRPEDETTDPTLTGLPGTGLLAHLLEAGTALLAQEAVTVPTMTRPTTAR